jgi:hypothetical protein
MRYRKTLQLLGRGPIHTISRICASCEERSPWEVLGETQSTTGTRNDRYLHEGILRVPKTNQPRRVQLRGARHSLFLGHDLVTLQSSMIRSVPFQNLSWRHFPLASCRDDNLVTGIWQYQHQQIRASNPPIGRRIRVRVRSTCNVESLQMHFRFPCSQNPVDPPQFDDRTVPVASGLVEELSTRWYPRTHDTSRGVESVHSDN